MTLTRHTKILLKWYLLCAVLQQDLFSVIVTQENLQKKICNEIISTPTSNHALNLPASHIN